MIFRMARSLLIHLRIGLATSSSGTPVAAKPRKQAQKPTSASRKPDSQAASKKEKLPKKPVSQVKATVKRQGTGSKSGRANRRNAGASDDEITELSQAQCDAAALKRTEVEASERAREQRRRHTGREDVADGESSEEAGDDDEDGDDEDELEEDEDKEDEDAENEVGDGVGKLKRKHKNGLTAQQKLVVVDYITKPDVYKDRRVRMASIANHVGALQVVTTYT